MGAYLPIGGEMPPNDPLPCTNFAGMTVTLLQISPASTSLMSVSSGSATLRRSLTGPSAGFEGAG